MLKLIHTFRLFDVFVRLFIDCGAFFLSSMKKNFFNNPTLLFFVILGATSNWVSSKILNPSLEFKTQFSCGIIIDNYKINYFQDPYNIFLQLLFSYFPSYFHCFGFFFKSNCLLQIFRLLTQQIVTYSYDVLVKVWVWVCTLEICWQLRNFVLSLTSTTKE